MDRAGNASFNFTASSTAPPRRRAAVDIDRAISAAVQMRLTVAREIVSTMHTLTFAGRHFAMQRVVSLFNDDVRRHVGAALGQARERGVAWLEQLQQEVAQAVPDSDAFRRTAESLMDAIGLPA